MTHFIITLTDDDVLTLQRWRDGYGYINPGLSNERERSIKLIDKILEQVTAIKSERKMSIDPAYPNADHTVTRS